MILLDIHSKILNLFDCKEGCVSFPSQVNTGATGGLSPKDGAPQQEDPDPLCFPQINLLIEDPFVRDASSVSNADVTGIPSQHRVTQQILSH
jgi:hypothetical protein